MSGTELEEGKQRQIGHYSFSNRASNLIKHLDRELC